MKQQQPSLLTATEVARLFSVTRRTIYRWMKEGSIPQAIRVGDRFLRWRRMDLDRFLRQRRKAS